MLTGFRYAMCAVTALGCVYLLNSLPERVHGMSEASKSLDDARSTMAALHWCPKTPGMCAARRSGPHFLSLRREGSGKRESILYLRHVSANFQTFHSTIASDQRRPTQSPERTLCPAPPRARAAPRTAPCSSSAAAPCFAARRGP